ncbi:MAG: RNA polymerase subunit sigma-70 [Clostridiales bacterium]|nr:RNA polymerase subunit sigma-70 [Clostridiales bacterium]
MTNEQKMRVRELRAAGYGYVKTAREIGLSENTVRSFCRRNGLTGDMAEQKDAGHVCLCCGKPVEQVPGRKEKKFCSDSCRMKWWNCHRDMVNRKAVNKFVCKHCGGEFNAYGNADRKYCSHACYVADRFGR